MQHYKEIAIIWKQTDRQPDIQIRKQQIDLKVFALET